MSQSITFNLFITGQKNVLAFISHCGAFGMQEAVQTATPVIGVPLHIDQVHNSLVLEELGVGIHLDTGTLTKEKLLNALNRVINDTRSVHSLLFHRERTNSGGGIFEFSPLKMRRRIYSKLNIG
jgi:hypothetical protein